MFLYSFMFKIEVVWYIQGVVNACVFVKYTPSKLNSRKKNDV